MSNMSWISQHNVLTVSQKRRHEGWKHSLQWRHNERDGVSNHQRLDCLLTCFIQAQNKENLKAPRHWPLWGEFTGTGEFTAQKASSAENVSIWWRHHVAELQISMVTGHNISRVSCQKGPTRHAYAWQLWPFWQDTLDISRHDVNITNCIDC